jgi:hypothetical protein
MNELATEEMESSKEPIRHEASGRPLQTMHTQRTLLDADDELVFPMHKRVVTEYSTDGSGIAELSPVPYEKHCQAGSCGGLLTPLVSSSTLKIVSNA